jgi:hypothetical protein
MIVFDLQCEAAGHRFEGWFKSSEDFVSQQQRALVTCPVCSSSRVTKAITAPNLARKGNQLPVRLSPAPSPAPEPTPAEVATPPVATSVAPAVQPMTAGPIPPEAAAMFKAMAQMQAEALKSSTWVGDRFADQARAMHYGEKDQALIHGQASLKQAQDLAEEGIAVAPVLFPITPPGKAN